MGRIVKTFRLNTMTGGINTDAEENALISFELGGQAEARDIENFMPLNRGGQRKTTGYGLVKNVGSATPITGLFRYIKKDGSSYFLVTYGAKLDKLVNGTLTNLSSSLGNGALVDFEVANDFCILCDGTQGPLKFDGATVAMLAGSPPGQARQSVYYQNRLFIFGSTANPSLLYYSSAGNIEAGYAGNFINCDIDDGQKITAIAPFFLPGNLEPIILVGKERSVGIVTGDGTVDNPYTFAKISFDMGIPGFRQLVQFGQDIGFLTPQGVSSYQTALREVNIKRNFLSYKVSQAFKNLPVGGLPLAHAWFDWKSNRLSFAVAEAGQAYPNVIWHLDVLQYCWYKTRPAHRITVAMVDTDGTVYSGDELGNIFVWRSTDRGFNGGSISAYYTTPYMDFGQPFLYKRILDVRITLRGEGQYGVGISTNLDFGVRPGKSQTLNLSRSRYAWGGGVWTNDPNVYQWGLNPIELRKFIPSGWFRNIQFQLNQSGANQPLDVFEIEFTVEFGDLR